MKIAEMFLMSKTGNNEHCEDSIVINDHFACVIDGVTSKANKTEFGKSSGLQAATIIGNTVHQLRKDVTSEQAVRALTDSLYSYYEDNGLLEEMISHPHDRLAATFALYSKNHNEVWIVGDCQCMIDGELFTNNMVVDDILANVRALYLELELVRGKDVSELLEQDTGRDYISPLLEKQSLLANLDISMPYSYGVVNGFHIPSGFIKKIQIPDFSKELVLASDGYPILEPRLQESEDALRKIIIEDPLCINLYKSTKGVQRGNVSYDDRAYLRIEM